MFLCALLTGNSKILVAKVAENVNSDERVVRFCLAAEAEFFDFEENAILPVKVLLCLTFTCRTKLPGL